MRTKRKGFFMILSDEDRALVDRLKDKYSVNISQAFRNFLKDMARKFESKDRDV
jgi:hypothetical protein